MPKSSMARLTPMRWSSSRTSWPIEPSVTITLSVTSIERADAGSPVATRIRSTVFAKSGSSSWRPDTLTATSTVS